MKRRHSLIQIPGSTNFITTTIVKFAPIFRNEVLARIVLDKIKAFSDHLAIQIHGYVIMPNHLHLLLTIGQEASSLSKFMERMKEYSAKEIIKWCLDNNEVSWIALFSTAAKNTKEGHKYQVWQKRFDNVVIKKQEDLLVKLNYIHNNPLQERWRLCERIEDYRFSSAKFYISRVPTDITIVKSI